MEQIEILDTNPAENSRGDSSQALFNTFHNTNDTTDRFTKLNERKERRKQKNRKTAQRRQELRWKTRRWSKGQTGLNIPEFIIHEETIDRICHTIWELQRDGHIMTLFKSYGIELKEAGVNYKWLCPRHKEKTPSFTMSRSKSVTKCFGCGKAMWTRRAIFELEFWEGVKYRKKKLLKLEEKLKSFLGKEKISQYDNITAEREESKAKQIEIPQIKNDEEDELPF